jgi:hypothetical protein
MRKRNRGRMRTGLLAAVGACAMVVATLATARVASASTSSQPVAGQRLVVISSPMKIVGFEQAVAAAHGLPSERTGRGGNSRSAAPARPCRTALSAGTVAARTCTSWPRTSRLGYNISTGFHVAGSAIQYSWTVDVYGPQGHQFSWGGGLLFRSSWAGSGSQNVSRAGTYEAIVTSPAYAILDDGAICESLHPTASVTV